MFCSPVVGSRSATSAGWTDAAHDRLGVIVGVQHDLHGELHAALAAVTARAAKMWLTFQRPERSRARSG
jgi:hypothetical protein